ncbi:MAG TPA: glycosyltransferase [Propionibacteriaceae bacterium]|nr:glycosyltransferase [Propionibacteriaceae bacterium]
MTLIRGNDWSALVPPAGTTWTPTRRVSICIPANNPSNLERVLDAVSLQTYPSSLMEVVIADDGSEPPITPSGRYPFPVSVVRLERTLAFGAGRGRNAAACGAGGDLLVFLDADIVPERQVIASYARWFVDRSDVLAMGLCRFADMEELTDEDLRRLVADNGLGAHFEGKDVDDHDWREKTFRRTDDLRLEAVDAFRIVIGATFAVSADQYWAVGGFRELGIRGIEDTEFGYRVHANGAIMVLDRDAVHWHQGRRNMSLDRREQIRMEREPYVERLLPVRGFRRDAPDPLDRPVLTVPRAVVHAIGDAGRLNYVRERLDPDHVVVGANEVAQSADGMPFVASFCDVWLPAEATISERSIRLITRELGRRGVGVILIHAPSGSVLVAMRTRVHRRICNDAGLKPNAGINPELLSAAASSFGVWHMAASRAEITWGDYTAREAHGWTAAPVRITSNLT